MERNRPRSRERFTSEESKGVNRKSEGRGTGKRGADTGALGQILGGAMESLSEKLSESADAKDDDLDPSKLTRSAAPGISSGRDTGRQGVSGIPGGMNFSAGQGGGSFGQQGGGFGQQSAYPQQNRSRNKGCRMIVILAVIIAAILLLLILGGVIRSGMGGGTTPGGSSGTDSSQGTVTPSNGFVDGWQTASNVGVLNTEVDPAARPKFTQLKGNGQDTVSIFVYMCGTDLESGAAMASRDLQEMLNANLSDKVNIIIYTGGCNKWQNNVMANGVNQIYQISSTGLARLSDNAGKYSMTDYSTLASFLKWGVQNYPADRKILIFWDHGGGSVSGYGYDERYPRGGSMTLDGIAQAVKASGTTFDIVGFDACLMATAETALMLDDYADYLLASEEVEPGIGWYYTDWLTQLSANTSISSLELGKKIADDFTAACQQYTQGQSTTLSLVDLAEFSATFPEAFRAFSEDANTMIMNGDYRTVANARAGSREFSVSTKIDQIDLVHFASLMNVEGSDPLISAVRSAVKYNRASRDMTNSFGLSVFFPYRRLSFVDPMSRIYDTIGIDSSYSSAIKHFAQMQTSGQTVGSGSVSPYGSLFGADYSTSGSSDAWPGWYDSSSFGGSLSEEAMLSLLEQLLGGGFRDFGSVGFTDLDRSNTEFLTSDPIDPSVAVSYIRKNMLDSEDLVWQKNGEGDNAIILTEDQWDLVESVDMAMYYDDGEGYVELGLDNSFDFDADGNLLPITDKTWLAIDGQIVAYYHDDTYENGDQYRISGTVPIEIDGVPADLILVFDNDHPQGYAAGIRFSYKDGETETGAKVIESLEIPGGDVNGLAISDLSGDSEITFICDYYSYNGTYRDSYPLGDPIKVSDLGALEITNAPVGDDPVKVIYRFTDIYGQTLWTEAIDL